MADELLVCSLRGIEEALRAGHPAQGLYLLKGGGRRLEELAKEAKRQGIKVVRVPKERLDRYSTEHQGAVLILSPVEFFPWQERLREVRERGETPLFLALDGVMDVGNMGAILRSCEVLGAHGVVIPKRRSAPITSAVVRASAGAALHLPIDRVPNLASTLRAMKEEGLWVVGTHLQGGQMPFEVDLTLPLVLVMGNEEKGLSPLVKDICEILIKIPMRGKTASLNVAAATAVLLYEVQRQRSGFL